MAASSFLLPSLSSQIPTISFSKPQTLTLALSFSSSKPFSPIKNVSFPSHNSFPLLRKAPALGSGIVPKVALSPELEQEEEEEAEFSSGEEVRFPPALQLYVGNIPYSVDSAQLADLFQRAGGVERVEVMYDELTGKSRGFGFVAMSTVAEAEAAAQQFNGYALEGRPLKVRSGPRPPKNEFPSKGFHTGGDVEAANRVYVGNLSWDVDNLALETFFSEKGKVLGVQIIYEKESGRSRGFGYVTYSSAEEAENAVASLNSADFRGRFIKVMMAEPKRRRQF